MKEFFLSFLSVINAMSPYLLLGFLIAGILHVLVPKSFYQRYLSRDNKLSVVWASSSKSLTYTGRCWRRAST